MCLRFIGFAVGMVLFGAMEVTAVTAQPPPVSEEVLPRATAQGLQKDTAKPGRESADGRVSSGNREMRPDRPLRLERPDRPQRPERPERPQRPERPERPERAGRQ